jgi:CheY-like chemotaxis protein
MGSDSQTILLVDDNELVRDITTELLEHIGYHVIAVEHPTTALDLLATDTPIDLLLTDLVMPGQIDGFALIAAALQARPTLKTLLASGHTETSAPQTHPATSIPRLTKPFRQSELARAVRDVLAGL